MSRLINLPFKLSRKQFYKVFFLLFLIFIFLNVNFYAKTSNEDKSDFYDKCKCLNYSRFSFSKYFDQLCDLLITVKTTKKHHDVRLKEIIDTWVLMVKSKVSTDYNAFKLNPIR